MALANNCARYRLAHVDTAQGNPAIPLAASIRAVRWGMACPAPRLHEKKTAERSAPPLRKNDSARANKLRQPKAMI